MSNRTFSVQKSQIHNFLTLSVISGNSEIATMEYQNKNFSSYSIRIKSVWLWFPASPWLNLWLIFLKSLKNSSRDLYNSFCGLESFKKCPSQGRVFSVVLLNRELSCKKSLTKTFVSTFLYYLIKFQIIVYWCRALSGKPLLQHLFTAGETTYPGEPST